MISKDISSVNSSAILCNFLATTIILSSTPISYGELDVSQQPVWDYLPAKLCLTLKTIAHIEIDNGLDTLTRKSRSVFHLHEFAYICLWHTMHGPVDVLVGFCNFAYRCKL